MPEYLAQYTIYESMEKLDKKWFEFDFENKRKEFIRKWPVQLQTFTQYFFMAAGIEEAKKYAEDRRKIFSDQATNSKLIPVGVSLDKLFEIREIRLEP